jgi:hypothetical protein
MAHKMQLPCRRFAMTECHISKRLKAECDTCGIVPALLHMPEHVHGWYCEGCCPVCRAAHAAVQQVAAGDRERALQAA